MQSSILICNNFLMSAGGLAYRTVLFTLVFSQTINRDDSWVKVGELAGKRERNSFLFRLRILLAERTLGGDSPGRFDGRNTAHAKTMYILSVMVNSRLAMSRIAHSLRARLTEVCFRLK